MSVTASNFVARKYDVQRLKGRMYMQREAAPLPRRVAIVGSFDTRLDFDLVRDVAGRLPDVDFRLHGWVHEDDPRVAQALLELRDSAANVHHFSAYANDELGEILEDCSVGLVPYDPAYHINRHVNPDKIYHYLRAGLEVVSTPIPQAVRMAPLVHVARDGEAFAERIRGILAGETRRNRSEQTREFTWPQRWRDLEEIVRRCREAS